VTVATPATQQPIVAAGLLEAMTAVLPDDDGQIAFDADALQRAVEGREVVVFGPGIGTHQAAEKTLAWLLEHLTVPLVIDADGLTCAARRLDALGATHGDVILTPHPGEMARLTGATTAEVQADRIAAARRFATERRCTLVLKGAGTVIASPDGTFAVNPTGNPGMASGGMGDVLAGVIGALLAQGVPAQGAAWLGVYAHGLAADMAAGDLGEIGLIASDVIAKLPEAIEACVFGEEDEDDEHERSE
jgi:NAD(P)H-hydrate epimerase